MKSLILMATAWSWLCIAPAAAQAAAEDPRARPQGAIRAPEHPDDVIIEPEGLPDPAPGRSVIADSRTFVFERKGRVLTLHDLDAEAADVVQEINRKPGTWQQYLLYTSRDLPEILFHPGFPIRLGSGRHVIAPLPEVDTKDAPPPPPAAPSKP
jgi:hypothetical protein